MPPKLKPDDFVEALLDSRVVDALAKALSPLISLTIEESLNKKLAGLLTSVSDIKKEASILAEKTTTLAKENRILHERLSTLEAYSKSDNLIIRGLPESSAASRATASPAPDDANVLKETHSQVEDSVLRLCKDVLGVDITPADISIAHRLKAEPKDRFRPIIVRFVNRRTRNAVYDAKKKLKTTSTSTNRVFIFEHLTKEAGELFFEARKLLREKKIFATWTHNGQALVRFTSDENARPVVIKCKTDLNPRP
jgi:regulator of replication initiation timing